jgi:hypothetical protein
VCDFDASQNQRGMVEAVAHLCSNFKRRNFPQRPYLFVAGEQL